jgi:tetratricopeptide (TPR) repeat protein
MGISWMRNSSWIAAGIILLATSAPAQGRSVAAMPRDERHSSADMSTRAAEAVHDAAQDAQDRKPEAQDRAQEARDREQEARDREQEKRERVQEQAERVEEAYDNGREALDEDQFDRAEQKFDEVAKMNLAQADAALYWKAYAQNKLGKRAAALATLQDLKQRFPQRTVERWKLRSSSLPDNRRSLKRKAMKS